MLAHQLKPHVILQGPLFPEPVQVIVATPLGAAVKIVGKGLRTSQVYEPILSPEQLATLEATPEEEPFDGDAAKFRLGIEAMRLALAYEYDPYFTLSIARVDPLPHQLEAVYDYFLKLPRIRFLLADDPGAGKTIMAGLLIKELKIRGLIQRILIVAPANLSFQWQREMQDKFREHFEVIRSDVLRANYGSNPWQEKNQVVTSVSWVSRIEDAKDSLLRSHWDLIVVDEAHKMSAYSADKKTLAYQLGEALSVMTDHYLLMTATPHKGDPQNFCLFLELLDRDVYGDVRSLEEAMRRHAAPFYLRRVKEASVTQIHGGMKIGDRDTPNTRISAEREFRDTCQVLVATEAAGEGINLQFCWFMINYDIPWNPVRLEQRMGRIHRYGQEKDCLIFNFVSTNTREGRVLQKLFERLRSIEDDLDPRRTGKIFNVLGDIFPANQLERMLREMYAHNLTEEVIKSRIVEQVAVQAVIAHEQARGWQVVSVEKENRGFDLISRKPHPEDPHTAIEVRFIEVKGRAAVGEVALTTNEYKTAERLKQDYWLYAVFNCAATPEVHAIQDPVRLGWEPLVKIEHYHVGAEQILTATRS